MKKIIDYLRLVRYTNLIFIVLLQELMARSIIGPLLKTFGLNEQQNPTYILVLLIFATVLIAAGGYVINDYFDIKIDRINRPEKLIITKTIEKKEAMILYQILTVLGLGTGLTVSWLVNSTTLAFIFLIVPGILWFYSASYKRQFLIGNLMISFCAALVPLSVMFAQNGHLNNIYGELIRQTPVLDHCYLWICGFSLFAFLTTFIREIIKDMQDEKGDREMECRTIPIKWGEKRTKYLLYTLIAITLSLIGYFVFWKIKFTHGTLTERYFMFGILLPFIMLTYLLSKAKTADNYKSAGNLVKFIMLSGTLYSLVFAFLQMKELAILMN